MVPQRCRVRLAMSTAVAINFFFGVKDFAALRAHVLPCAGSRFNSALDYLTQYSVLQNKKGKRCLTKCVQPNLDTLFVFVFVTFLDKFTNPWTAFSAASSTRFLHRHLPFSAYVFASSLSRQTLSPPPNCLCNTGEHIGRWFLVYDKAMWLRHEATEPKFCIAYLGRCVCFWL